MSYETIKAKYADKAKAQTSTEATAKANMDNLARQLEQAERELHEAGTLRNKVINKENSDAYYEALQKRNLIEREYKEAKQAYEDTCAGEVVEKICERIM
jgi:hypothetical protein